MPKYLCDYCDVHLNFDSQSGRKQHNRGRKHQENVRGYYAQYAAALAQANREAAEAGMAPVTGGLTLMPPSQTAGQSLKPLPVSHAPSAPAERADRPPPGQPFGIRTLGPAVNNMGAGGPPRGPPGGPGGFYPPQQGGPPGGFRGPPSQGGLPPPPFSAGGMPPPPFPGGAPAAGRPGFGGPPSQQQSGGQAPPPQQAAAAAGQAKPLINADRMRALGLQGLQ